MNTIDISQYTERIVEHQKKMLGMLHDGVSSIILPEEPSTTGRTDTPECGVTNKRFLNGTMLAGGIVAVVGLFVSSPFKWLLLGSGAFAVAYGLKTASPSKVDTHHPARSGSSVNFVELVSRINRSLSTVNRNIVASWDDFIAEQKNQLKNQILQLDVDIDRKNEMMDIATKTSVLEYTMASLYTKLNNAAQQRSMQAFASVCSQFEHEYKQAIEQACRTQISIWSSI